MSKEPERISIMQRVNEIDARGEALMDELTKLKKLYRQGYRYVDQHDKPFVGEADNVINITRALE